MDTIDLAIKALGGGGNQSTQPSTAGRSTIKAEPPFFAKPAPPARSKEKCCIFKDDIPGDVCYEMPCGCVYSK